MNDPAPVSLTITDNEPNTDKGLVDGSPVRSDRIRTLARLVIGGVEVGFDELVRLLQVWEEEVVRAQSAQGQEASRGDLSSNETNRDDELASAPDQPQAVTAREMLRFALIGLIFETQERVGNNVARWKRVEGLVERAVQPWIKPIQRVYNSHLLIPARSRYEHLAARGQSEVVRWVALGHTEEAHSRMLAQVAFDKTVDEYIEYLTTNPEVQELVQSQSTGLASEVIEEVRERTVSADNFLEGVARSLLRRMPRSALPEPPTMLRQGAVPRHPPGSKRKA